MVHGRCSVKLALGTGGLIKKNFKMKFSLKKIKFGFQWAFLPHYTRVKIVLALMLLFHQFPGFPFHEC